MGEALTCRIRLAAFADLDELARVHVAAARAAYAAILPEADLPTVEQKRALWQVVLADPAAPNHPAVHLAEVDGAIVGFAASGPQRVAALRDDGYSGDIRALYILADFQRGGIGRKLMSAAAQHLADIGCVGVMLWSYRQNHSARRFYEALGGTVVAEDNGIEPPTVSYGWRDLARLMRPG